MNERVIDFTADELRDIANAMDNPNLRQGMDIEGFIERMSLK